MIGGMQLYAYIKGRLEYKSPDYIVVEANGVGYRINTSLTSLENVGQVGSTVKIYTHLYVREDNLSIYGFTSQDELSMFELLITVTGIGPKVAVSIVSSISPSKFGLAVITDDVATLTKVPGVGKKTAQRIILELKDKIRKEQLSSGQAEITEGSEIVGEKGKISDAINALIVLGYSPAEAAKAVSGVYSESMDVESIIRNALKSLVR